MAKKGKGRPSKYSKTLADTICGRIACGESLKAIARDEKMPAAGTLFAWLGKHQYFQDQYARACAARADAFAEEMIEIADDGQNDWMRVYGRNGEEKGWALNHEHVQRSKLRVDTRKWNAARMAPKKYGDKLDMTSDGKKLETAPLIISKIKPRKDT